MDRPRRLIFDASPAIHLAKLDALAPLEKAGWAILPESVVDELFRDAPLHEETVRIRQAMEAGLLRVRGPNAEDTIDASLGLTGGEADCVRLWREGLGSQIVTDDGKACRRLLELGVPFLNTPLLVVSWLKEGHVGRKEAKRLLGRLRNLGRYSDEVWAIVGAEADQASAK